MLIGMVANSVNAMVIVSTGDTNPHFGDFHFQNLAVIFNYQLSIINYQLSIHRPLSAKEYLPKSI